MNDELLNRYRKYGFTFDQLEQQILYNTPQSIKDVEGNYYELIEKPAHKASYKRIK
jgi:hypothetical protein